ncbi:MAG: hypothetical protein ACE5IG_07210 [Dehalococcoidia bacterium]
MTQAEPRETRSAEAHDACAVCGGALDGENQSTCYVCARPFHQPWRAQAQTPQCGHVLAHEEALGLVFVCRNCYPHITQQG